MKPSRGIQIGRFRISWGTLALVPLVLLLAGCPPNGCNNGGTSPPIIRNVMSIHVASTAFPGFPSVNKPYVSVTICAPTGNPCQTVDNILIDTGSVGLRLFNPAFNLSLPPETSGTNANLYECAMFGAGGMWGAVSHAAVTLGNEAPITIPIQVANVPGDPTPPAISPCSLGAITSPASAGVNGLLGLAPFNHDQDSSLIQTAYFACTSTGCNPANPAAVDQIPNPVFNLGTDSNGVIIHLPAIAASGAVNAGGDLIFGIGTANPINDPTTLSGGSIINVVKTSSFQTPTGINGDLINATLDTGSAGIFFPDSSSLIARCKSVFNPTNPQDVGIGTNFYCPSTPLTENTLVGPATATIQYAFQVAADSDAILQQNLTAFSNLSGTFAQHFLWGMPFFYGHYVYIVYGPVNDGAIQWTPPMWAWSGSSVPGPTVASLSPNSGPIGTSVTINGYDFGASQGTTSTITFNGKTATPTSWGQNTIVAPVPAGATTGNVIVTVNGQTSPPVNFTVTP